jgi:hypothetical protein
MKRCLLFAAVTLLPLGDLAGGQYTIPLYVNIGNVTYTNPPQIDAYAFANYGTFEVASPLPFDFMNTLCYTNRGRMLGYPGFRFDYTDDFGIRRPAQNFINEGQGSQGPSVATAGAYSIYPGYSNYFAPTHIFINATNVVSSAYLGIENTGILRLDGQNIDLSGGGLEVQPLLSSFNANSYWDINDDGIIDQFSPDNAIYDYYWGAGIQDPPIRGPIWTPPIIQFTGTGVSGTSPGHQVWINDNPNVWYMTRVRAFSSFDYPTTSANTGVVAWADVILTNFDGSLTNYLVPTNIWRQAVVVGVDDTNFVVRTKFFPSYTSMPFGVVAVGLEARVTNLVTDVRGTEGLYFVDYLGCETNLAIWNNHDIWYPATKARPAAYEVWRTPPFAFNYGMNGNSDLFKTIVYDRVMSNTLATNFYAGYYCMTDYLEARPPMVPGATPTNLPGRIEIVGDTVDLSQTRVRGMGSVSVNAKHFKGSAGAKVDVQYLAYDLASTNGLLTVQNLSKEHVERVSGDLAAWSGVWTNQMAVVLTNWGYDANSNWVGSATNVGIDVSIHCLILSAHALVRTQPVVITSLNLRSTNVVELNDPAVVGGSFVVDAPCFTLNGRLVFTDRLVDWVYTNAPNLRYFTNNGTLSVRGVAFMGSDYPYGRHWSNFVNRGTLQAVGIRIAADSYEDGGIIQATHDLGVFAGAAKLEGGNDNVLGDMQLFARDLKLKNQLITAGRGLFIGATNSLTDSGGDARNYITVNDGFRLLVKPKSGDLLGTTFETRAPQYASVAHTWAGEDRGPTRAGFKDNAAIGKLVLKAFAGSELRFGPETGNNGLYVDYLNVTNIPLDQLESSLVIEPGLTIYFADANAPVEELDGKFGGQLRWVKEFAGPWSGVDVALRTGQTVRANRALVDSRTIDTDGDGLANGYDDYPFDGVTVTEVNVTRKAPFTSLISWQAAASTVYQVEYATNLVAPKWQRLAVVTNAEPAARVLTVTDLVAVTNVVVVTNGTVKTTNNVVSDLNPPGGAQRYYRVRYDL